MNFRHDDVLNFNDSNIVTFGDGKFKGDVKEGGGEGESDAKAQRSEYADGPLCSRQGDSDRHQTASPN